MNYNYRSDFDFILDLKDANGVSIGFPTFDFRLLLRTSGAATYEVSSIGGVKIHCTDDDGKLHVVLDRHGLMPGRLKASLDMDVPNALYCDGGQLTAMPLELDIYLIAGPGDVATATVEAVTPYALITAYDLAVANGYVGTKADFYATLATVVAAELARSEAESQRVTTEQGRQAAEALRASAEVARSSAEVARAEAESARSAAESGREDAESARVAAELGRVWGESGREAAEEARVTQWNALGTDVADAAVAANAAAERAEAVADRIAELEKRQQWYGIEYDTSVSLPTCTRIGSSDLHRACPIQNKMRGCLLDDDGNVVEYLDPDDWRGNVRDGSRGQVMVEIPRHYRKFETDGTKRRVLLSELPLSGYHCVPKAYVSAYQATIDRIYQFTPKLASVASLEPRYRGGNNNSALDGAYNSMLGKPATLISRTDFRNYARNRKAGSYEWNCMTYDAQKNLMWLFVVEYATLNSQKDFNAALTAEGYHQGGLGAGVSTLTSAEWNSYNGYCPLVNCGVTDALGNQSGVVTVHIENEDHSISKDLSVPRYRGIENPFAHIWQWTDGINVRISPTEENGGDGLSKVFVCSNPRLFKDIGYDGYSHVGNESRNNGYVKEIIFGEGGEIMPSVCTGGGSTTYFCDYHYTNIPTAETLRGVVFGGRAFSGAYCGFASAYSDQDPSIMATNFGTRLCFIPNNNE